MMRLFFVVSLFCVGCAPAIGDDCGTSADCSVNGDRICDLAYPGGYCTVAGCEAGTCPDESVCVEWRFSPDRTAVTFCMATCGGDGDCRGDYACMDETDERMLDSDGGRLARALDGTDPTFCVGVTAPPLE
ncbi:MAG: hypothetical protein ACI9KE_000349 [Polyangiales bacterium]|jgi:hypothetical protein